MRLATRLTEKSAQGPHHLRQEIGCDVRPNRETTITPPGEADRIASRLGLRDRLCPGGARRMIVLSPDIRTP